MFNRVSIVGRLGRDPKLAVTQSGKQVCTFSVAVDSGYGENKITDWFSVSAFGKTAEICGKHLEKGALVGVGGEVHLRTFKGKDGSVKASLDLLADYVKFVERANQETQQTQTPTSVSYGNSFIDSEENNIPF